METGRVKILIVDDDESARRLVSAMLKPYGYEVIPARDGAEGIELTNIHKPAVVLMDVVMPKIDGYTALGEIKKNPQTSSIPVIMLTGIYIARGKELAEVLGSNGYLTKPFSRKELVEAVAKFARPVTAGVGSHEDTG